jgi:hypothetical protein
MTLHLIGEASFALQIAEPAVQKRRSWNSLTQLLSDLETSLRQVPLSEIEYAGRPQRLFPLQVANDGQ